MNSNTYQPDINGIFVWNPQPAEGETVLWSGTVLDGYAEGEGKLTWYWHGKVVSVYEGDMHKGRPHGKGKYKFADGDVYDGQWQDGLRHGIGTQQYKNGETYDGQWLSDKPHPGQ